MVVHGDPAAVLLDGRQGAGCRVFAVPAPWYLPGQLYEESLCVAAAAVAARAAAAAHDERLWVSECTHAQRGHREWRPRALSLGKGLLLSDGRRHGGGGAVWAIGAAGTLLDV